MLDILKLFFLTSTKMAAINKSVNFETREQIFIGIEKSIIVFEIIVKNTKISNTLLLKGKTPHIIILWLQPLDIFVALV